MAETTFKKALLGAMVGAAVAAVPATSQAAAYGYATFQLNFFTFEAEYNVDTGGTAWARPGSHNLPGSGANFEATDTSTDVAGSAGSETFSDNATFDTHVPPAGTFGPGFPVDPSQAFVNISGSVRPGENDYTETGNGGVNGSFARADAIWSQLGAQTGAFGNTESAGEADAKVAEGYLSDTISDGNVTANANNTFRGQIDLGDNSLDSGADASSPAPTSWTGRLRARFDYHSELDLTTDLIGELVTGEYGFNITVSEINPDTGNIIPGGYVYTLADFSSRSGFTTLDVNRTVNVQSGQDFSPGANTGTGLVVWNIPGLSGEDLGDLNDFWQIDIGNTALVTLQTPVPAPAPILLMGAGLAGLGASLRRRRKAA